MINDSMINDQILRWLFPKKCLGCGSSGGYLCHRCQKLIVSKKVQICPVCNRPTVGGWTHRRCWRPRSPDGLISLFSYHPPLSQLIKEFKYYRVRELASELEDLMARELKKQGILDYWQRNQFLFLPVPLFPLRQLWRGFNQSEILLAGVCQQLDLPYRNDLLVRRRRTKEQAQLSAKERRKNVVNSFQVKKWVRIKGKNFVVFDDVWTTGSTLKECVKALKSKGAAKVWGLTLAG